MIDTFITWFQALGPMQQIYWTCAILGSTIFLLQMVLTLIGIDASDVEVDFDGSDTLDLGGGLSLFSIRALINFLVGFGWSGVSLATAIGSQLVLAVVSILVGLFFAYIILMLYRRIRRLEHNGVFTINACVGLNANCYLRIPGQRSGRGKVQVSVGGSVHEIDAITDGDTIPTGSLVRIKSVEEQSLLLVEKI